MKREHHSIYSIVRECESHNSPDFKRRAFLCRAVALGMTATGGFFSPLTQAKELEVGKLAPPLVLNTLDGHTISTRDLIGKVVIATFWATWCAPCYEELPLLSSYAKHHAQQGLRVLGFCLDGPEDLLKVKNVAANLCFPVGLLGDPWAGEYGRIWHIPVSFVIDRSGRLADNGWKDDQPVWTAERLQRVVDPLLFAKNDNL